MSFLKKFSDHVTKKGTIRKYLHDRLGFVDEPRSRWNLHASDLTKEDYEFCPRERALQLYTGHKGKGHYVNACLSYTFMLGHYMAEMLIHEVLVDIVVGDWKCTHCGGMERFCKKPKAPCKTCGGRHWKYEEVRVKCKDTGVSCGLDVLVKMPTRPKLTLLELKSISKDEWPKLKAPMSEHRLRTNLYLSTIARSEYANQIDCDNSLVVYMIKGYGAQDPTLKNDGIMDQHTPFKEFEVIRKEEDVVGYFEQAKKAHEYMNTGKMPEGICEVVDCKRATKCSMRKQCFSGDYKAGAYFPLEKSDESDGT